MKRNSPLHVQDMSTISVSERIEARMAGGFYLVTILTGAFTQLFISHLVVSGNAASTAAGTHKSNKENFQ